MYDQVNEARKRRPEVLAFCQRVFIRLRKSLYGEFIPAYGDMISSSLQRNAKWHSSSKKLDCIIYYNMEYNIIRYYLNEVHHLELDPLVQVQVQAQDTYQPGSLRSLLFKHGRNGDNIFFRFLLFSRR